MKLYKPVLIESVEQAEALPVGTVLRATFTINLDPTEYIDATAFRAGDVWWSDGKVIATSDLIGWTALVPVEAEEVWGSQDKSGGISRAHAGAEDPHATVKLHIAERTALGHPDRLVSHYVTPWEEA